MSESLKEKMVEAVYEMFVNAQIHSETEFIYTCGQFFPQKNKIEFTIVDTGVGFRERVNKRFNVNMSAEKAILWAVQDKNTTKEGVSGGIGLALLKEFVERNMGLIVENSILRRFEVAGKSFKKEELLNLLTVDERDFVDKALVEICKENSFVLLTNDRDFKNTPIEILTLNKRLLG